MGLHMGKSFIRTICERIFLVYLTHTNLGKFIQRYQSRYSELKIIIPQILICIHTIGELGIFCDVYYLL